MESSVQTIEVEAEYILDGKTQERHEFINIRIPSCIAIADCNDLDIFLLTNRGLSLNTYLTLVLMKKTQGMHVEAKSIACII